MSVFLAVYLILAVAMFFLIRIWGEESRVASVVLGVFWPAVIAALPLMLLAGVLKWLEDD